MGNILFVQTLPKLKVEFILVSTNRASKMSPDSDSLCKDILTSTFCPDTKNFNASLNKAIPLDSVQDGFI